jgi:hypothetical protein
MVVYYSFYTFASILAYLGYFYGVYWCFCVQFSTVYDTFLSNSAFWRYYRTIYMYFDLLCVHFCVVYYTTLQFIDPQFWHLSYTYSNWYPCVLWQTSLFMQFLETHPECQIRERHFIKLKTYYVRVGICRAWYAMRRLEQFATSKDKLAFPCPLSMQLPSLYKRWLGQQELQGPHKNIQMYDCFVGRHYCPRIETALWHKYDCFMGLCNDCGVSKFPLCPLEVLLDGISEPFLLQWKCFEETIVG